MSFIDVVLPRRVVPQPMPFIRDGGDCGACVLGGLIGVTVPQVYERHDGAGSINRPEVVKILSWATGDGLIDHFVYAIPYWKNTPPMMQWWGETTWWSTIEWFDYVAVAMRAGYYAVAFVDFSKKGPLGDGADHVVLLCGARERRGDRGEVIPEVLVSCSARSSPDEEWVSAREFLRQRGGYNVVLARPT